MTYIIVKNAYMQKFVDEVNSNIAKGFEPIGGATSIPVAGGATYMIQAMINKAPLKVLSEEFKIIEKGIVPGVAGPEYVVRYQHNKEEHTRNLGAGLRNYTDRELRDIILSH